jgi:hypothetical protein
MADTKPATPRRTTRPRHGQKPRKTGRNNCEGCSTSVEHPSQFACLSYHFGVFQIKFGRRDKFVQKSAHILIGSQW